LVDMWKNTAAPKRSRIKIR